MGDNTLRLPGRSTGRGGFTIPLGGATRGRLVFTSNVAEVMIHADPGMKALARGQFGRNVPYVRAMPGTVIIQFSFPDRHTNLREPAARVNLNASVPWEIEFGGDARRITADLQALQLNSLDILGTTSQVTLALSEPVATGYIYLAGEADQVRITRPYGAGVRIQLHNGGTRVALDEQHFDVLAGEALLESRDFSNSASQYNISICGNINNIEVSPRDARGQLDIS